jgi:hypothetical protein
MDRFRVALVLLTASLVAWAPGLSFGEPKDDQRENLITNGDFERGTTGWTHRAWAKKGLVTRDPQESHEGHPSVRLHNPAPDNSFLFQVVVVKPETRYRLSGWIKTKHIVAKQGRGDAGATLWIESGWKSTPVEIQAEEWTYVTLDFSSGTKTSIEVGPRLGQWGGIVTGTAWFSGVSLVELGPPEN